MFSLLILTIAAAQAPAAQAPAVESRMPAGPQAMLEAEIIVRPAGTSSESFIAALAAEAGAGGWQRVAQEFEEPPLRFGMIGFRNPSGGRPLVFYFLAGDDVTQPGRVCRVRLRARPGTGEGDEVPAISRFCVQGIVPPQR